jgi:putative acetyltransferase
MFGNRCNIVGRITMALQDGVFAVHTEDYARVVEVWEASVRATHHFVKNQTIEIFRQWCAMSCLMLIYAVLVNENGVVVGFIGIAGGKIEMLFIHPDWRGQGIGAD